MRSDRSTNLATHIAVTLGLVAATVLSGVVLESSSAAPFAATASVTPQVHFLGDSTGTTFTFTVENTGTVDTIGAVEIGRPSRLWTVIGCPSAPTGWTAQRADTMCRYRSAAGTADDIAPGATSSGFQVTATMAAGTKDVAGTWSVKVSKSSSFDKNSKLIAAAAEPPGLGIKAHSFEVLDAVVDPSEPLEPGDPCPTAQKTATAASTGHTLVICGRNRTTGTLTPTASRSSLAGTFIGDAGTFSSGAVPPTATSVVLGSWADVVITPTAGTDKTVVARIGSAADRTSPLTTLTEYVATPAGANDPPVGANDSGTGFTTTENASFLTADVLANDTDPEGDPLSVASIDTTGTQGTVTDNGDGTFGYDPNGQFESLAAGDFEDDTFTYTVSDGTTTDTATVTIRVTGIDDAPIAVDDSTTVLQDADAAAIDVLVNDTDVDGGPKTIFSAGDPAHGTVVLTGGSPGAHTGLTYEPDPGYCNTGEAPDTFSYVLHGGSSATVSVTVTCPTPNTPPVAADDAQNVGENSTGAAVDVLGNDTDADADPLAVGAVDTTGTAGTVTNNGTSVTYDPNGEFEGLDTGETATDTFTYTVSDGRGGTDTATVTITIIGANDAPVAVDDAQTVAEDGPGETVDVLANDTDIDVETLTVTAVTTPTNGGAVTNNGTDVTFDPSGDFESLGAGETDTTTFTYTVSDGTATDTATVTVTVTGAAEANNPPVAVDDAATRGENSSAAAIDVLANDTDADSDPLTIASVDTAGTFGTVTITGGGTSVSYNPNGMFEGLDTGESTTDTFTYTIVDGHGGTDTATVTVTITGANDAPVAVDDAQTVAEDGPGETIDVLANDTDIDLETLFISDVAVDGTLGTVTLVDGVLTYDPNGQFESLGAGETDTDTFVYTVTDGTAFDQGTVTITITGADEANTPPVAVDDAATRGENSGGAAIDVLANDTDANGDPLTITTVNTAGTFGTVTITGGGTSVSYNPNGMFEGLDTGESTTDTFTYTIVDGHGGTDTATVTVTITGSNDAPVAVDDAQTVAEDGPGETIDVLANDTDIDLETLFISDVAVDGTLGTVTLVDGVLTYDPNGQFESLGAGETDTDTFVYTVTDGTAFDQGTVTITITGADEANIAPVAVDDAATRGENSTGAAIDVLANDTDANGDTLTITTVNTAGTFGTVTITGGGTGVSYNPNGMFEGLDTGESTTDTFTYTIVDGHGGTDTATVTVTITGANDAPVAVDDAQTVSEDSNGATVNVLANDTDLDLESLTVDGIDATGTTGQIINNGTNVTYDPNGQFDALSPGETDTDTFTYTVTDGTATDTATVTITITGADDAPVAVDDSATVVEDAAPAAINVLANDTDADGGPKTIASASDPANGTVVLTGGTAGNHTGLTYQPDANHCGADSFTYTLNGGDSATVSITVTCVNDAPVIANLEGAPLAYAEGDAATPITATGTVGDNDSVNFSGGTLTVDLPVGGSAGDELGIRSQGFGTGQIGVSAGSTVKYANATIGVFAYDATERTLDVTLTTTDATLPAVQALLRNVTFHNTSDLPSSATRTARFVVTDGDGGTSAPATRDITVATVNDDPVAVDDSATVLEDAAPTAVNVLANDTDADGGAKTISSASDPANGTVVLTGGTAGAHTGLTYAPDANYCNAPPGTTPSTFTYTLNGGSTATVSVTVTCVDDNPVAVNDTATVLEDATPTAVNVLANDTDVDGGVTTIASASDPANGTVVLTGGTAGAHTGLTYAPDANYCNAPPGTTPSTFTYTLNGGSTATVGVTVTCVGDNPVAVNDTATVLEDAAPTAVNVLANDTDVDGGTKTIASASDPTNGAVVLTGGAAGNHTGLTYQPDPDYCNAPPGTTPDTFTYTLNGGSTATVSMTVTCVDEVNVAPVIANLEAGALAYTENDPATPITASGTVTDTDSANFSGGSLTASFSLGGQAEDRLEIRNQGLGAGQIGFSGGNVSYEGVLMGTAVGGVGTAPLDIALNTAATPVAVQALLRNITYRNVSDLPSSATRTARFEVTDGDGGTSAPATRTITVAPVDDRPLAVADSATVLEDAAPTSVPVLANDTDVDAGPKTISSASDPANGTVVLTGGSAGAHTGLTYQPDPDYCNAPPGTTPDTFTYTLNGGTTATVSMTVTCIDDVNVAPVIANLEAGALAYVEGDTATPITATGTVTDPDSANFEGGTLTVDLPVGGASGDELGIRSQGFGAGQIGVTAGTTVKYANLTIGVFEYDDTNRTLVVAFTTTDATIPAVQALLRNITYRTASEAPSTATRTARFEVSDGDGGTSTPATRDITVAAVSDNPVAVNDSATVLEDAAPTAVAVLTNDTDVDGGPKTIASASDPANGTVVLTGGTAGAHTGLTYAPDANYCNNPPGTTPSTFTYTLNGGSTATVSMTVTCVDDNPVAVNNSATVNEDDPPAAVLVLANDTDVDGGPKVIASATQPANGTVVLTGGSAGAHTGLTYQPSPNYCNSPPGTTLSTFTYTLNGGSTATVSMTVTCVDDLPVAVNDSATVAEDAAPTAVNVLANDTDVDGGTKLITAAGDPANGTVALTGGGTGLTYQPDANYCNAPPGSTLSTFTYTVTGGSTATVSVTVTCVDDAPVAVNNSATFAEDDPAAAILVLANDTDIDGGPKTIASASDPTNGTVVLTGGTAGAHTGLTYQPDANYCNAPPGTTPSTFTYTLNGGSTATVSVTVTCVDDRPLAVNDAATVLQNSSAAAVAVLTNDTDIDGGPKTIASATDPANGTVVLTGGTAGAHTGLTYAPDAGYCNTSGAPDTFTYVLNGGTSATVSMTVTCTVNNPPNANNDTLTIGEDTFANGLNVLANDTDADGDTLTITGVTQPIAGVASHNGTTASFNPNGNFDSLTVGESQVVTFTYTISDGNGGTDTATVTVTVLGVNDVPVIAGIESTIAVFTEGGAPVPITASGTVSDIDSDDFATGTLTTSISTNGHADDRLAIRNQGTGAGQIGVSGANVTYGGVVLGTFTGGTSGTTPLVVTLNATATPAATQALLRNITFANVSENPTTSATRVARFVLTDGDGGTSAPVTRNVIAGNANDAPVIAAIEATALPYTEHAAPVMVTQTGTITDLDNSSFTSLSAKVSPFVNSSDTLTIRNQGTGAGLIGVSGSNVTYGGVTIGSFTGGTGFTTLQVTLNPAATTAATQALLRNIMYSNDAGDATAGTHTVRFQVGDGGTLSNEATRNVTVTPVNDPPFFSFVDSTPGTYVENNAAEVITTASTFLQDLDSPNFGGGNITLDITAGGLAEDRLEIRNQGTGPGQVGTSGSNVTYEGVLVGTFSGGTSGTTPLVIALNAATTPTVADRIVKTLTYRNVSDAPSTAPRTTRVLVNDGDGGTSLPLTRQFNVIATNDAPVIAAIESAALSYPANGPATPVTATGTITDVDSATFNFGSLTVDFSAGGTADDRLAIRNQGTGAGQIGVSGSNVTYGGALLGTFTGGTGTTPLVVSLNATATPSVTQALLRNITFSNVSGTPAASRTVRFVVRDGAGGVSTPATRVVTAAANAAPFIFIPEATSLAYAAGAAAVVITPGASVMDADSANFATGTLTVGSAVGGTADDRIEIRNQGTGAGQIGVSGANVTYGGVLIGTFAGGTGTTALVVTLNAAATPAIAQSLVQNITFRTAGSPPGVSSRSIQFVVTDGDGGTSSPALRNITVTGPAAPPVVALSGSTTAYTEDAVGIAIDAALTVTDADSANLVGATFQITGNYLNGTDLILGATTGGITSSFDAATGRLTLAGTGTVATYESLMRVVRFTNTGDNPGSLTRTITISVNDGSLTSAPVTKQVTVTPVNDAPSVGMEGAVLAYTENAPATPTTTIGSVNDPDSTDFAGGNLTADFSVGGQPEDRLAIRNQGTGAGQIGVSGSNVTYAGVIIGTFTGGTSGTTPLVVAFNANVTPAVAQALHRNVTYQNVSDAPSTTSRTVRVRVADGDGGTSGAGIRTITITAVDDAPVVTAGAGSTAYTEQAAAVTVAPTLTVTDVDGGPNPTGATVTIASPVAGDTLAFTNTATITGVFSAGVLTLSGTGTIADFQAALRTVQFANAASNAPGATRVLGFQITTPVASNVSNKTIAITQVNDPAVVSLDGAGGLAYAEQVGFLNVTGPAATVTDPDSPTLASLTVTLTSGFDATFDTLRLNPLVTGFTTNFTGGVLTLTRAGGTIAEYQNALRNVQFGNTDDDPDNRNDGTANGLDASRTLSVVVNDGALTSSPVTRVVTIAPVNDAPGAPSALPTVAGVRNTTLVTSPSPTEPHVVRSVPLIGNAVDPDNLESAISVVPVELAPTTAGGIIAMDGTGNLRYEPPASGTLTSDTYGYTLTDGTTASSPITFTVNLSGAVWYVIDQNIVGANGTASQPFASVAAAVAAAPAGQPIHIRRGFGDGIISGAATLGAGDKLLGEGVALTNVQVGTSTVETLFPAGTKPILTASGADVVTLATNTTVTGVSINPDGAGGGLFGTGASGVLLSSLDVTDTGTPATQPAIEMTGSGNGITFTGAISLSTTQAGALAITGSTLAGTVGAVTVSGTTTSPGIALTNVTNPITALTFGHVAITSTGQPGVVLNNAGTVLFPSINNVALSSTSAKALDAQSTNLGTSVIDSITVAGSGSGGVRLNAITGSLRLGDGSGTDLSLQTTSGATAALDIASSNGVVIDAAGTDTISATGGPAVDIRNSNGSQFLFDSVSSTGSANDGVNLDTNLDSPFDADAGAISGAAGTAFDVNGGGIANSTVNYDGTINDGTGHSVEVTGRNGSTVTFTKQITDSADAGGGITVSANSAGSTVFSGTPIVLNTGASTAVSLSSNGPSGPTGHAVAFTGGGLDIDTTSGAGLTTNIGGEITVMGTGNTLTSGTGVALNLNNTMIGVQNLIFQSISANGATSGIVLNSTNPVGGTGGSLRVLGTGTADSGGTIANTTGPGISLTQTDGVSLNNIRVQGANRAGIQGVGVTGFSLTNSTITGSGDSLSNIKDSSIAFNDVAGGQNNNVDGVVTITGNTLSGAFGGGVDIFNYAGTITSATISNNTISSSFDPAQSSLSGIALNLFGSTTTVASLTTATINNNTVNGFPSGDGISVQGANTASASAPSGTYGTPGGAAVTISGNQVIGDATNKINGFGISASVTGRGQGNFVITNNGTVASPIRNMKSSAIAIGAAGDVTTYFTVTGNQINANNGFSTAGIALGTDKNIQADLSTLSNPQVRATITGNTIANTSGSGVRVLHRDSNGTLNLRLDNNTITNVLGSFAGIRVENGSSGSASFNPTMCASITNNAAASGPVDGFGDKNSGINLYKSSALATTYKFGITGLAPSPATNPQVESYVTGLNPTSALGAGGFAGRRVAVRTGSNYTSCTLPAGM